MNKLVKWCCKYLLICTLFFAQWSWGAELQAINWNSGSSPLSLTLKLDQLTEYQVRSLGNDRRLQIVLPNTRLGDDAVDIGARGFVKGVFPYVSDNGTAVYVDFLMEKPGSLKVASNGNDLVVVPREKSTQQTVVESDNTAQKLETTANTPRDSIKNQINDITFAALAGDRIQVNLSTSRRPQEPGQFSTNNPPRLIFDFFDTENNLSNSLTKVGIGAVESIHTIQASSRTRMVFNLVRSVPFQTQINDDGMVFVIQNPDTQAARVQRTEPKPFAKKVEAKHSVNKIDFRRSREGGGRVIIELSDPTIGIDVREEAGEIIVDFLNTGIDDALEQRLDVVDFATPVQTIDTFQEGNTVRVVITPQGKYQQLSYQSGNIFNINIDPVIELEEEKEVDEFGYSGERLSLNFQKISVRAALQVIADFTGLNFVTSDSVTGSLTLRLKDVPWDQALDIILQTRGLGMRQSGNVVWVAPANEIAARERQQLESTKEKAELEPLTSELIQINYAKAADIADILKSVKAVDTGVQQSLFGSVNISEVETESNSLLSPRGNVTVDARTNSILIQDTAAKISQVRQLIAELDKPVRQVLIETRIVEATDNFSRSLGARLGFQRVVQQAKLGGANIGDVTASGNLTGTGTISSSLGGGTGPTFAGQPDGLAVNLPAPGVGNDPAASYAFEIFKAGTGIAHLIQLEISALEAEGKGKIIANPRLITSNQQEARIEQGQERIFTTSVLGVGSVVTKKAVLSLTVTPQITPDDRVVMDVFVTQDAFVSATDPTINTKQITTQVLLENGETAVIGGIYQQDESVNVSKVPILGDIPGLGLLFRNKTRQDNRTELLIFLTPRIVNPALNIGAVEPYWLPAA